MQLHELSSRHSRTRARRIGRGGKRGKTSGRGHKGQKSRAGRKIRPEARDIIKKMPKLRGHGKNRGRTVVGGKEKPQTVTLAFLARAFPEGGVVNPRTLLASGVVRRFAGKLPLVKIVATGTLTKKLTVSKCSVSQGAHDAIVKAGGVVVP